MTVHRYRQSGRRPAGRGGSNGSGGGISDAGATLTIVQIVVCIVMLVTVFTLQYVDKERYARAGELYRAVMSDGMGEAVYVGAFGTPITRELLEDYTRELSSELTVPKEWMELGQEPEQQEQGQKLGQEHGQELVQAQEQGQRLGQGQEQPQGQGGESPYIPPNLYLGRVLLSAAPVYPVYGRVTSPFGGRSHPISEKVDFHTGVDIAAKQGDSVYAILPGTVAEVGSSTIYGNYIRVTHAKGLETVYNHCSEILAAEGAVVRGGERIARVGSTGVSTGPHLHLDLLVNDCYADPLQVFEVRE